MSTTGVLLEVTLCVISGILIRMHKPFYASGFLYHPPTEQILLRHVTTDKAPSPTWCMVSGIALKNEEPLETFKRCVHKLIAVSLDPKRIFPVYDYFHNTYNTMNYVFYAEVKKLIDFSVDDKRGLSWVTFKQTMKLPFDTQSKQDVIIAERVIKAQARSDAPPEPEIFHRR